MLSAQSLRGEARMEIMMIDTKAIEEHIRGILVALGDDPEREGLKDTPKRVTDVRGGLSWDELLQSRNCADV